MSSTFVRPLFISLLVSLVSALPTSSPNTAGEPSGDYSPSWQSYFKVNQSLPNITFDIGTSYAGNIGVQREGHPNNTLFFWGFEKHPGSLTADAGKSNEPWAIWLNGGPGSSSMLGLFAETGPITIRPDGSAVQNEHGWNKISDYFFVDSPVGVGYSTADAEGYVPDEDQLGRDLFGFLSNLVKVFPSLATRPLHITGESYAGNYIPYILKTYFSLANPPVKVAKIAIGDGTMNTAQVYELISALTVIETFPQIIGYDTQVYEYFREQHNLCNYNFTVKYPGDGPLPNIPLILSQVREIPFMEMKQAQARRFSQFNVVSEVKKRFNALDEETKQSKTLARRSEGGVHRRDLSLRANGTIDPWYGCDLLDEFIDYAINYTYPWNNIHDFDIYDVADAMTPNAEANLHFETFMNNPTVRSALHAPTTKDWSQGFAFTFGQSGYADPSPEPIHFLSDLAQNATKANIGIVFYSGNNDAMLAHRGTEVTIQNMTWGGVQGFSRKPSTPFKDDQGTFAGIIHQERGVTYALFDGAGHLVPMNKPAAAFTFARDFIFGNNPLGRVEGNQVNGGEDPKLAADSMRAAPEIYLGPGFTQSTYVAPSATIAAWDAYIATAAPQAGVRLASNKAGKATVVSWGVALGSLLFGFVMILC